MCGKSEKDHPDVEHSDIIKCSNDMCKAKTKAKNVKVNDIKQNEHEHSSEPPQQPGNYGIPFEGSDPGQLLFESSFKQVFFIYFG